MDLDFEEFYLLHFCCLSLSSIVGVQNMPVNLPALVLNAPITHICCYFFGAVIHPWLISSDSWERCSWAPECLFLFVVFILGRHFVVEVEISAPSLSEPSVFLYWTVQQPQSPGQVPHSLLSEVFVVACFPQACCPLEVRLHWRFSTGELLLCSLSAVLPEWLLAASTWSLCSVGFVFVHRKRGVCKLTSFLLAALWWPPGEGSVRTHRALLVLRFRNLGVSMLGWVHALFSEHFWILSSDFIALSSANMVTMIAIQSYWLAIPTQISAWCVSVNMPCIWKRKICS